MAPILSFSTSSVFLRSSSLALGQVTLLCSHNGWHVVLGTSVSIG
ncbi:mCG1041692 [Mus musculus]|nr:mCG1041692 [Mus musculus]